MQSWSRQGYRTLLLNIIIQTLTFYPLFLQHIRNSGASSMLPLNTSLQFLDQNIFFWARLRGLLKKDEDILLVTDQLPIDQICEKITKEWNIDVKSLEANGRITLMTFAEWHLIDGKFDIARSKIMMSKMVRKALDHGRKGFRSIGDMNPFFSKDMIRHLVNWESSLVKQFDLPITSLCVYTKDKLEQLDNSAIAVLQQHHNRMMNLAVLEKSR